MTSFLHRMFAAISAGLLVLSIMQGNEVFAAVNAFVLVFNSLLLFREFD